MFQLASHRRRVLQFPAMGQALLVLCGLCAGMWRSDAFAVPLAVDLSEQGQVVSKALGENPYERLVRGQEALEVYARAGDRAALTEALEIVSAVAAHFSLEALKARQVDTENAITFARFSNMMFRYTGQAPLLRQAQESLSFVKGERTQLTREAKSALQQAEEELRTAPLHITVVGAKSDVRARQLWTEAVRVNDRYVRREWWDRREGALPNPDVRYPNLAAPAAFVCIDTRCSVPLYTEQDLRERLAQRAIAK